MNEREQSASPSGVKYEHSHHWLRNSDRVNFEALCVRSYRCLTTPPVNMFRGPCPLSSYFGAVRIVRGMKKNEETILDEANSILVLLRGSCSDPSGTRRRSSPWATYLLYPSTPWFFALPSPGPAYRQTRARSPRVLRDRYPNL
jgi:hypothetical protein